MTQQIRRVVVWSGWLRVSHAALALATLVLLATGWLLSSSPTLARSATDIHYLAASILIAALALRVFLGFFGKGAERFEHMLPRRSEFAAIGASFLFYLTLGKAPLPNWFAHNPLWKPIYLILFMLLALSALTGWVMPEIQVVGRLYLPRVHGWLSNAIWIVTLAHLFSVVLQDVKGGSADVSGILNGQRCFSIEREGPAAPGGKQLSVKLEDFGKS